jgi:hypothetical protein
MGDWKGRRLEALHVPFKNLEDRFRPGGLRSLAAVEAALGLVFSAHALWTSGISDAPPGYDGA